jgi:hypothetical protein
MGSLDAIMAQYDKNQKGKTQLTEEERMKRYFTLLLSEKETTGQRRIRILPTIDGSTPFKEAHFHEVRVKGYTQKFYDPGLNDNEASPLTDIYNTLRATGKKEDEEMAKEYKPRLFYVLKVIDRDHEEDGPKYWRFKHNYKKDGILDKIIPIIRTKGDITDIDNGRDLIIDLVKTKTPKGKEYTTVSTIMFDDPTPLSTDAELVKKWSNDESTWKDVYTKKPKEYLEAIGRGETPQWDNNIGKFVYLNTTSDDNSFGGGATVAKNATVQKSSVIVDDADYADDDLPF